MSTYIYSAFRFCCTGTYNYHAKVAANDGIVQYSCQSGSWRAITSSTALHHTGGTMSSLSSPERSVPWRVGFGVLLLYSRRRLQTTTSIVFLPCLGVTVAFIFNLCKLRSILSLVQMLSPIL
jgi:hypothetical protein